jgi:hypothetical protein
MTFMCVFLVELLHHAVMRRVSALEYMLSGACGLLRQRPILPGAYGRCLPRPRDW